MARSTHRDGEADSGWDDGLLPAGDEVLLERRTDHAVVRIEQDPVRPSGRLVFLDGVAASYVDLDDPGYVEFTYIQRFADIVDAIFPVPAALRITHVGGGAVGLPRYFADTRPRSSQLVYELDGRLIELAREHLGLVTHPGLRVKIGDALPRMQRRSADSADVVITDAFVGRVVPEQFRGAGWLELVRHVLVPDGLYLLNVIDGPDPSAARRHARDLQQAFRTVLLTADPDVLAARTSGNLVFLATDRPLNTLPLGKLMRAFTSGPTPDRVIRPDELSRFIAGR